MKQELLEYIIRACVKEVLTQVNEADDETKGAPAPPADGQGTADQPPIPKAEDPAEPEADEPEAPPAPDLKGVVLVNPRDKSKLQKVPLRAGDDASLERTLHQVAAVLAGNQVKIALSTMRLAKDAARNPNTAVYLYIGKYDPQSDEVFLMADKSLQVAKDSSIPPTELTSGSTYSGKFPDSVGDVARRIATGGRTEPVQVNENLKAVIKTMVNELLDSK